MKGRAIRAGGSNLLGARGLDAGSVLRGHVVGVAFAGHRGGERDLEIDSEARSRSFEVGTAVLNPRRIRGPTWILQA